MAMKHRPQIIKEWVMMRLMPVSIDRIISENRLTDVVFRRSWSWKDYFVQYAYIVTIMAIMFVFDYSKRILLIPLWVYGFVCVMYIAVRIAFNITANKNATEIEDKLIKRILCEAEAENEVYSHEEIKERLLLESHIKGFRSSLGEIESW